jgi:hypothetical protein
MNCLRGDVLRTRRIQIFILAAALFLADVCLAEIDFVSADEIHRLPAEVTQLLLDSEELLVNVNSNPALRVAANRTLEIFKKLVKPGDFNGPVHLYFTDDYRPNAQTTLTEIKGYGTAVGISLGLFKMADRDAEVAAALSHELEHHFSQLQKRVDALEATGNWDKRAEARLLRRTVEIEVDLRSRYRLAEAGFPIDATATLSRKLRKLVGDAISPTHAIQSARVHAISAAAIVDSRFRGLQFTETKEGKSTALVDDFQRDYLQNNTLIKLQREKIRRLLDSTQNPATKYFKAIESGTYTGQGNTISGFFDLEVSRIMAKVEALGHTFLTNAERLKIETEANEIIEKRFQEALDTFLANAQPTHDQLNHVASLFHLHRKFHSVPDVSALGLLKYYREREELATRQRRLSWKWTLDPIKKMRREDELRQIQSKLAELDESYQILIMAFSSKAHALAESYESLPPQAKDAAFEAIGEGSVLYQKYGANDRERNARLKKAALTIETTPQSLKSARDLMWQIGERFTERGVHRFEKQKTVRPEELDEALRLLKTFTNAVETSLNNKAAKPVVQPVIENLGIAFGTYSGTLKPVVAALLRSPKHYPVIVDTLRNSFAEIVRHAKDASEIAPLFHSVRNDVIPVEGWNAPWTRSPFGYQDGFVLTPKLAHDILNEEFKLQISEKLKAILQAAISSKDAKEIDRISRILSQIHNAVGDFTAAGPWSQIQDSIRNYATGELLELFPGASDKQLESLVFARFPALYSVTPISERPSKENVINDLASLWQASPDSVAKATGIFPIADLVTNVPPTPSNISNIQTLLPAIRFTSDTETMDELRRSEHFFTHVLPVLEAVMEQSPEAASRSILEALDPAVSDARVAKSDHSRRDQLLQRALIVETKLTDHPTRQDVERATSAVLNIVRTWGLNSDSFEAPNTNGSFIAWQRHVLSGESGATPERVLGFLDAVSKAKSKGIYNGIRAEFAKSDAERALNARIDENDLRKTIEWLQKQNLASPSQMTEMLRQYTDMYSPQPAVDRLLLKLFESVEPGSDAARKLLDPSWIARSLFDSTRKKISQWQLNERFRITEQNNKLKSRDLPLSKTDLRGLVGSVRRYIDKQFKKAGAGKNAVLQWSEEQLLTNAEETRFLQERAVDDSNWYQSDRLYLVDAPQILDMEMQSNSDRWDLLQYYIGDTDTFPQFVREKRNPQRYKELAESARDLVWASTPLERAYLFQPLLDPHSGLLSTGDGKEMLFNRILGAHAKNEVARTVLESYLVHAPPEDGPYLLGYAFGSLVEKEPGAIPELGDIFRAGGPFGAKVAQALRAASILPADKNKELDGFFDKALPPTRQEIYDDLKQIYGDDMESIENVRHVVGSGSINYVVLVDVRFAHSTESTPIALRITRSNTRALVKKENEIWEKVLKELSLSRNKAVRRFALVAEELRQEVMHSLGEDGDELNQKVERENLELARKSYQRELPGMPGWKVEVTRVDPLAQKQIPEKFQKSASAFQFVNHVPVAEIGDPKLRADIARAILDSELLAIDSGVFDPEGHPGNWLVDIQNKRLVRLDMAKLVKVKPAETQQFKQALRSVLHIYWNSKNVDEAARELYEILDWESPGVSKPTPQKFRSALAKALASSELPAWDQPLERLLFLRKKLGERFDGDGVLGFQRSVRPILAALARTRIQGEHLEAKQYVRRLAEWVDVSEEDLRREYATKKMWDMPRMLCAEAWRMLRGK